MKLKKILFAITVLSIWIICIGGCERDRNGDPIAIIVKNNTKDTVSFVLQFNYPDTVLINSIEYPHLTDGAVTYPFSKSLIGEFTGWERTLREEYKTDGLVCIVYSLDTLRKYPFEQIQQDYNILERHVLSIEDLKEINWTIEYP